MHQKKPQSHCCLFFASVHLHLNVHKEIMEDLNVNILTWLDKLNSSKSEEGFQKTHLKNVGLPEQASKHKHPIICYPPYTLSLEV